MGNGNGGKGILRREKEDKEVLAVVVGLLYIMVIAVYTYMCSPTREGREIESFILDYMYYRVAFGVHRDLRPCIHTFF